MNISNRLIQSITEELKTVVNQDINYFNNCGYIVASTDKNRIGDFHQGALIVLNTKKNLVIEKDDEYLGSRKGINLPVYLNEEVVGVIGITGEKDEVKHYGKIIQKITQILLRDAYLNQEKTREKESRKRLLEEIIYKENIDVKDLSNWFKFLKINVLNKKNIIVINIVDLFYNELSNSYIEEVYGFIKNRLSNYKNNLFIQMGKDLIIAIDIEYENIENISKYIEENILKKFQDIKLLIGIGINVKSITNWRESYLKADLALRTMRDYKEFGIKDYRDLDIEILFSDIKKADVGEYINKVFKSLDISDIENHSKNFITYIENNGSIKKSAEQLFIHKNTVQYRLDRLYIDTGYNPRELKDMIKLYIAFNLIKYK